MSVGVILGMLFAHWVADFVLQTDWQARNKSKSFKALLWHTLNYGLVMWVFCMLVTKGDVFTSFYFWGITLVAHTITDYFTSRLNTRLWENGRVHNFFVSIGFDQWLHYAQLFGTYYLLT